MPEALPEVRRAFRPRGLVLLVAIAGAGLESGPALTAERIAWQHPNLALFLADVRDARDGARIELCVQVQPGRPECATTVGFPRYQLAGTRWFDAVSVGIDRSRSLRASADSGPACFSVLLPRDATMLHLPIGGSTLALDTRAWLAAAPPDAGSTLEVDDLWNDDAIVPEREPQRASAPRIVLDEEHSIEGAPAPVPRDRIVGVRLRARNAGQVAAHGVVAWIEPGSGVFPAQDAAARIDLGEMAPGAIAEFVYRCYADRSAAALTFQVTLDRAGDAGGGEARVVSVPLADSHPAVVSDVDRKIPSTPRQRPTALAVVLGVEQYADAPPATFAAADAETAARYFERALGIPPEHIEVLVDREVTLAQLQRIFDEDGWLARRVSPEAEVFVFFAGHGMAETDRFAPYLLPFDANPDYVRQTGFLLDRMIERLAALGARRTTLFLDACFGGLSREGGSLLDGARPLVVERTRPAWGGVSVFSAGSASQIASSLAEERHGLFSYFLFKGLGGEADLDGDRRILAGELERYLDDAVPRAAQTLDREQLPGIALDDPDALLVQLP